MKNPAFDAGMVFCLCMTAIHKCCDGLPDAESYKMGWGRVACVNGFTVRGDYKA